MPFFKNTIWFLALLGILWKSNERWQSNASGSLKRAECVIWWQPTAPRFSNQLKVWIKSLIINQIVLVVKCLMFTCSQSLKIFLQEKNTTVLWIKNIQKSRFWIFITCFFPPSIVHYSPWVKSHHPCWSWPPHLYYSSW